MVGVVLVVVVAAEDGDAVVGSVGVNTCNMEDRKSGVAAKLNRSGCRQAHRSHHPSLQDSRTHHHDSGNDDDDDDEAGVVDRMQTKKEKKRRQARRRRWCVWVAS